MITCPRLSDVLCPEALHPCISYSVILNCIFKAVAPTKRALSDQYVGSPTTWTNILNVMWHAIIELGCYLLLERHPHCSKSCSRASCKALRLGGLSAVLPSVPSGQKNRFCAAMRRDIFDDFILHALPSTASKLLCFL